MRPIPKLKDGDYDIDIVCKNQRDLLYWAEEAEKVLKDKDRQVLDAYNKGYDQGKYNPDFE